ncbi:hypothetical protein [Klebsiella aerogenes]|uniref:hypothetical protein n=1 Tax=Klebsiella aerogenes TaxID=548 RepID=UPI000D86E7B8|nr:hypothetical protein [Klebsiella aerogenes]PYZ36467.1 hypothetical protein DNK66_25215 [Klebsiella aerogenes]
MPPSYTYLTVSLTNPKNVNAENLAAVYRDWMNNYLSIAAFAEDYGITEAQAEVTIAKGREIHNTHADWIKEFAPKEA